MGPLKRNTKAGLTVKMGIHFSLVLEKAQSLFANIQLCADNLWTSITSSLLQSKTKQC